jgi:hypothetical protein
MGVIQHHAIVVQGDEVVRRKAMEIMGEHLVSEMIHCGVNGYEFFFVSPDGSKEGWELSDEGNDKREKLIEYFEGDEWGGYCSYVEVSFGECGTRIENHNCEDMM